MRVLWITNITFPEAQQLLDGSKGIKSSGGWMLGAADQLVRLQGIHLSVASISQSVAKLTRIDGKDITYYLLPYGKGNLHVNQEYELLWRKVRDDVQPDIVHIHGTEFSHGLAYVDGCGSDNVVVSIQGLTSVIARYYLAGLSFKDVFCNITLRDVAKGTLFQYRRKFERRGRFELELLQKVHHVIGRTNWDKAHVTAINTNLKYHFCNETLRSEFYEGQWQYGSCKPHSIFVSSASYPIKGFHQLLKALPLIIRQYPDVEVRVAGTNPASSKTVMQYLKKSGYQNFIYKTIKHNRLKGNVLFLGFLNAQQMKDEYLSANVYICPSSIENSSNSLGEAQMLGVPVLASYVGGIPDMMQGDEEHLYRFEEIEIMANKIIEIFDKADNVCTEKMRLKAYQRHNVEINAKTLFDIYESIMNGNVKLL